MPNIAQEVEIKIRFTEGAAPKTIKCSNIKLNDEHMEEFVHTVYAE